MNTSRRAGIVALLFVYVAVRVFWWFDDQQSLTLYSAMAGGMIKTVVWVVPIVIIVSLFHHKQPAESWPHLGLDADVGRGLLFGLIATLPMALVVAVTGHRHVDPDLLIGTALLGPFAEEVLFRGFLLRELHTRARWPLAWAIAVSAIAFGVAHVPRLDVLILSGLYQVARRPDLALMSLGALGGVAGQVAMMAAGGAIFAWVFYRCGSLWPAIGLHGCLNLWLTLAQGDATVAPLFQLNATSAAQLLAFALALILTFRWRPASTASWSAQPS